MKCPRCQQENPASQKFCGQCGSPLATAGSAAYAELQAEIERLRRSLADGTEQQAATAEILKVISSSPKDAQPVFDTIVRSAVRLCSGVIAGVSLVRDGMLHHPANYGGSPEALAAIRKRFPRPLDMKSTVGVAILTRAVYETPDAEDPSVPEFTREAGRTLGVRSFISVPMLREGNAIGAITVTSREPGHLSEAEVALLRTFADQAVIAIENVRLFTELQASNRDLTTALDTQTATSDILRVISQSQTDVHPVFDTIVQNAVRLSGASHGAVYRFDGTLVHSVAHEGFTPDQLEQWRRTWPRAVATDTSLTCVAIRTRQIIRIGDVESTTTLQLTTEVKANLRSRGSRSILAVPMIWQDAVVGAIGLGHPGVDAFSDAHVELLQTFADQAVIAIENVRLFTELQASNRELTTALDTQTATSDILRVISRSQTDVQPVFNTIVQSGLRLLGGFSATMMLLRDNDCLDLVAYTSTDDEADASLIHAFPLPLHRAAPAATRAIRERRAHAVEDVESAPKVADVTREIGRARGWRSNLFVPMIRDDVVLGLISITRRDPGPFAADEIALLQTFADQAVIAIENVRLFRELQTSNRDLTAALDKQTATSEILRVISQSPTDVQPVFDIIAANAVRLCDGYFSAVLVSDCERVHVRATHNLPEWLQEVAATGVYPASLDSDRGPARVIRERRVVHIHDAQEDEGSGARRAQTFGYHTWIGIPMMTGAHAVGAIGVARRERRPFSDNEIALLQTFADQAVIAIENVRLFAELQARTGESEEKSRQLEVASRHKSEFLANMSHELRTPLNAVIGFSEVLNEGMFGELNEKQADYLKDIHASGQHLLSLINDILDLSKIEAGRMELELSDFDLPTALDNALTLVRERAGRRGIALSLTVDERLGQINADERKVRQVLLNLLSNAIKFTPEGGRIEVRAVPVDGNVEVSVSDTGVGIAPEDREAIFEEFKQVGTASKKVEGTGLGLALSRKFVELHGGRIWVKSEIGQGSTFTFTIPLSR